MIDRCNNTKENIDPIFLLNTKYQANNKSEIPVQNNKDDNIHNSEVQQTRQTKEHLSIQRYLNV